MLSNRLSDNRSLRKFTSLVVALSVALLTFAARGAALNVPLTIQELLPADDAGGLTPNDVVGRDRAGEPVTSGIPLSASEAITDVSQLAVADTGTSKLVPAQFRVLHCYPQADGTPLAFAVGQTSCATAIQWVLVDLQASVSANGTNTQYALVKGTNPATGTLANDNGSTITINTGAATFTIIKARQNLLDSATVGATTLVRGGHAGGVIFDDFSGTEYRSDKDPNSTAVIEENGPLRTVVKEQGRLTAADGTTHSMGYTARLSFYKGKSYIRAQVSIENAFRDDMHRKQLGSVRVDLPTAFSGSLAWILGTQTNTATGTLSSASNRAHLYQAHTTHGKNSDAIKGTSANASPLYGGDGDIGAPFTAADLVIPVPSSLVYPSSLVGTTLNLRLDDRSLGITFASGSFSDSSAPKPTEVVTVVANAIKALGDTTKYKSFWDGNWSGDPGAIIIRDSTSAAQTSIVVGNGTANDPLGLSAGQHANGQNGYEIIDSSTSLHAFGGDSEYARGFGDLSTASGVGVSVAMRNFDSFFPDAIEFDGNGMVTVELISKHNTKVGMWFDWGVHETRDITLDFHTASNDPTADFYRIQYPLFARAPWSQYVQTGGILGRTHLLSVAQIASYHANTALSGQFLASNGATYGISGYVVPNEQIVRRRTFAWGSGGSTTNDEYVLPKLLAFLSTGEGGLYQTAYDISFFVADQAVHHSDREDRATWSPVLQGETTGYWPPEPIYRQFNGGLIETSEFSGQFQSNMEHMNVIGTPVLYYLSGDQFIYDGLVDLGEWLANGKSLPHQCEPGQRGVPQRGKWNSLLWELTGDFRYKTQIDAFVNDYLCARIPNPPNTGTQGQDQDRGFVLNYLQGRELHSPIESPVRAEGMLEIYRVLPNTDYRKEMLADYMLGFGYWGAYEYYWDRGGSTCNSFGGTNYKDGSVFNAASYYVDVAQTGVFNGVNYLQMIDWSALMAFSYGQTQDPWFLYVGQRNVANMSGSPKCADGANGVTVTTGRQPYTLNNNWSVQDMEWSAINQAQFGSGFLNDDPGTAGGLTVANNGGGSYTLSWTVPQNALRYEIKYGPQVMVPYEYFDRTNRTYRYDPATYDNFWSGNSTMCSPSSGNAYWPCDSNADCTNGGTCGGTVADQPRLVRSPPVPATAGSTQSFTVSGLDPRKTYHFALRIYTGSTPSPQKPIPPTLL